MGHVLLENDGYPLPTVVVASEPKMTLKCVIVYQTCRKDREMVETVLQSSR